PDTPAVRAIVAAALSEGRTVLTEPQSKQVLAAYGIPVVETRIAHGPSELAALAASIGYPVALKILSPDISHKSDVGGVALDLAPLNSTLTRELISRTRVARVLAGGRGQAAANLPEIEATLVKLAQLAIDVAEIVELDINPLLADEHGVVALDARVRVAASV